MNNKFKECKYFKSDKHIENANIARFKGYDALRKLKSNRILEYEKNPKICLHCGKTLPYKGHNRKKFCNSSCSATYHNYRRVLTNETKNKMRETHKKKFLDKLCSETNITRNCIICNKEFVVKRNINNRKLKSKTCSTICSTKLKSKVAKEYMDKKVKDGSHKGWTSRNVLSYPEKFFIEVLKNNNIFDICKINYPMAKSKLGEKTNYNYFLDFYFEDLKLDLEIDGKQHKFRKEHDLKRDELLMKNGIKVYRIDWKNINTDSGKLYIENEIDKFLNYFNSLKKLM